MTPEETVVYISPFLTELAHTYGESQTAEAGAARTGAEPPPSHGKVLCVAEESGPPTGRT